MSIKRLTISGLRGFSNETTINFALPDKVTPGSGLTILVGPNNSGKSTIIEAVHLLVNGTDTIPIGSRNFKTDYKVKIEAEDIACNTWTIETTSVGGAFVQKKFNGSNVENWQYDMNVLILSNKRNFPSTFYNNGLQNRKDYKGNVNDSDYRNENNSNTNFGGRLLNVIKGNRSEFNKCLEKIINPIPNWTIESTDSNNWFLEFKFDKITHSSKGAGDGYINIFNIIDSLYDSTENNVILIDEPEISLHPDLQRKLFDLLAEYSKDKQIIITTHSPYFVDWNLIAKKTKIIRLKKEIDSIKLYELKEKTKNKIPGLLNNHNNPHILSINSNEIFFLNDNIILTEGQDDVICYKELLKRNNYFSSASFFGWGIGGADNIECILNMLEDLGYNKVFTILDNDRKDKVPKLEKKFKNYCFFAIAADDVRNKKREKKIDDIIKYIEKIEFASDIKKDVLITINSKFSEKIGLIKDMKNFEINPEYEENFNLLIDELKKYFENNIESTEINDEKNNVDDNILENEQKAHDLLDIWLKNNIPHEYIKNKYKNINFTSGGGAELSFKKISRDKYYAIISQSESIDEQFSVTMLFHIVINIKKNKVKLKRKQIVSNTLPISKIRKTLEKILN